MSGLGGSLRYCVLKIKQCVRGVRIQLSILSFGFLHVVIERFANVHGYMYTGTLLPFFKKFTHKLWNIPCIKLTSPDAPLFKAMYMYAIKNGVY